MQTTRSASNNRVGLFARSSAVLSSSRRRQPRRRHFTTIKNNDAKTRGKVFRAYDKRREEDNLEEDKEEDRNVPFLYDEILYQFGEDQEEDSFDETSREDEEEEEEQRRPAGLLSKTTTTTTTTKRVTKVEIMGAGDSKPTSASSSEQQQILLQQQKQKQNRPIDVAEAMRVGDKSKDAGGLHPRGHGAMGKQPLNSSNALNSGNETTLSSTRGTSRRIFERRRRVKICSITSNV